VTTYCAKNFLALIAADNHVVERTGKVNSRLSSQGFRDTMVSELGSNN
jgi:hypothetical protein